MIEEEPLLCEWSEDELRRFFGSELDVNLREGQNDEAISSGLSNVTRTDSYRSEFHGRTNRHDRLGVLLSDAFVSVLLTCRMEHECYATVAYEPIKNSCRLSMPDEVEIQISREGFFDIGVGREGTELSIRDDELTFSSKMNDDARSVSIYNLRERKLNAEASEDSEALLVTTDSLGNIFKVNFDGNVIRDDRSTLNPLKKARFFAVNRNLTGFEYLHKSERDSSLREINLKRSESMFFPVLANGLEYRLFLNSFDPTTHSKKWLQKVGFFV